MAFAFETMEEIMWNEDCNEAIETFVITWCLADFVFLSWVEIEVYQ